MEAQCLPCALEKCRPNSPVLPISHRAVTYAVAAAAKWAAWGLMLPSKGSQIETLLKSLKVIEGNRGEEGGKARRKEWKWMKGKQALSYLGNSAVHNESFPSSSAGI